MNIKKCACGGNAWFGNYCHECRDRAIRAVTANRKWNQNPNDTEAPSAHHNYRRPMSGKAADAYAREDGDDAK